MSIPKIFAYTVRSSGPFISPRIAKIVFAMLFGLRALQKTSGALLERFSRSSASFWHCEERQEHRKNASSIAGDGFHALKISRSPKKFVPAPPAHRHKGWRPFYRLVTLREGSLW